MLTVNAPRARMAAVVLCPALMHMDNSLSSLIPPQAAFITHGVFPSPKAARMNTGCG